MNAIVQFVLNHGYSVLFGGVFARQLGLPVPAPLFLLAGGALAASGELELALVLGLGIAGCVVADWLWYEAGRMRGDKVLHLIDRFALDPAALNQKAKNSFARFGSPVLVFDKFVPGLDAVAPPLAGTSGTSRLHFLSLETTGATLYSLLYAGLGYVFSHNLDRVAGYTGRAGTILGGLAIGVVGLYGIRKIARSHCFSQQSLAVLRTSLNSKESERSASNSNRIIEGQRK